MTAKTDNRSVGGRFEQEMSHRLSLAGFWVHVFQQNRYGQPADIIAAKGNYHTLIDCKACEEFEFPFSRVEENQKFAMKTFFRKAGELCYFALRLPDGQIRMISMSRIEQLEGRGKKRLFKEDFERETRSLESWVDMVNALSKEI